MAFSPKYTVTAQMLANLAKIEVIKQQFENQPISPQLLLSLQFIIQRRLKEIV